MKKKILQPNIIKGYDDKGNLISYYWQEKPFQTRSGSFFTIPRRKWWNPIWRFNQWSFFRKTIVFGGGTGYGLPPKGKVQK